MQNQYDVIIIGSGFGGSVSACRLAEAGKKVLVLERGKRWEPKDYPRRPSDNWFWRNSNPYKQNGWIDLRIFRNISVAQGAGVGGGSLIYANVSIEAQPDTFETGWPTEISYQILKPYYDAVGKMLNVQKIPDNQLPESFYIMQDAAQNMGYGNRHHKIELAVTFNPEWNKQQIDPFADKHSKTWINPQGKQQGTCVHCANCDIGCQVQAKNTLDLNYLATAENHDAKILPSHLVSHVEPVEAGYTVHFQNLALGKRKEGSVTAAKVILAAGSLGSTEILLRSRDEFNTLPRISSKLGHNWAANGDFVTPAIHYKRDAFPTRGPTISSAINLLDGEYQNEKMFIEDGGIPGELSNCLKAKFKNPFFRYFGIKQFPLLRALRKYLHIHDPLQNIMLWFGQAVDVPDGQMYLGRYWYSPWKRCLKLNWNYRRSKKVYNAMASLHRSLAIAADSKPLIPPTWTVMKNIITPHPLGGCIMADDAASGVVNHRCEVFNYPNLYVMDGSVIPGALGLNPSRTIAALAERASDIIIRDEQKSDASF